MSVLRNRLTSGRGRNMLACQDRRLDLVWQDRDGRVYWLSQRSERLEEKRISASLLLEVIDRGAETARHPHLSGSDTSW